METIHFKFDELTAMASEHDCLELITPDVSINSAAQTTPNNKDTPLSSSTSSSTIVEDQEAPPLVSSSEEQISPISTADAVESV
ncbi:hypothetical protein Tco_0641082 [Tanacetum coccineum]